MFVYPPCFSLSSKFQLPPYRLWREKKKEKRNTATDRRQSLIPARFMAATLSTSLISNTVLPLKNSSQSSPRVFSNSSHPNLRFHSSFSYSSNTVKFSPQRTDVVVSAISGSPGKLICSVSIYLFRFSVRVGFPFIFADCG